MIPGWLPTLAAFCAACGFFTIIGLPLARAVAPRGVPALGIAPALGWAVYNVLALPLLTLLGFNATSVSLVSVAALLVAIACWRRVDSPCLPRWTLPLAAIAAWLPAIAIMPKHLEGGILLAPPLFDHVKIAIVDAILRRGLPVPNPFYGPANPGHLAYYYLWHVSTAVLASALHVSGWGAEAAMTGFTAFASLTLMMSLAAAFGAGTMGLSAVILLCLPGSLRPVLGFMVGGDAAGKVIPPGSDLGGWLNQAAWVPQHMAGACCAVVSALLMLRLAEARGIIVAICLGLTVAAGFESSVWVGGIGFAGAGMTVGMLLLWKTQARLRGIFIMRAGGAACLAGVLCFPLFLSELHAAQARGPGSGLAFMPYPVFGAALPKILNLPGFWLILLPFSWPALMPCGRYVAPVRHQFAKVFWFFFSKKNIALWQLSLVFGGAFLCVAWLFRSTIDNNDLGWRAVLPALLLLTPCAACGVDHLVREKRWLILAASLAIAALGVPDTVRMMRDYTGGQRPGDARALAQSAALWQAVRRHTAPDDRVANNPSFIGAATPWPVNISWATLSDRASCFAGWETVLAYSALPKNRLVDINDRFTRVFAGKPLPGDLAALAHEGNCATVVLTPEDGAWANDPFAGNALYALAEKSTDWRIYTRMAP